MTRRELQTLLQRLRFQLFGQTAERQICASRERPRSLGVSVVSLPQTASSPGGRHGERIAEVRNDIPVLLPLSMERTK